MTRTDGNRRVSKNEPGSPRWGFVEIHTRAGNVIPVFSGSFVVGDGTIANHLSAVRGTAFSPETIRAEMSAR